MKTPLLAAVFIAISIGNVHASDLSLNLTGTQVASLKIYSAASAWGWVTGVYLPTGATEGCSEGRAVANLSALASDPNHSEKEAGAIYTVALANHTTLLQSKQSATPLTLYIVKDDVSNACTLLGVIQDA